MISALRRMAPKCKFYYAASSECFGEADEVPQTEKTRFHPRSPYGVSKVAGFHFTMNYRESYNIFACSGILFNHESPRRGYEFVTRKITSTLALIKKGKENVLLLGNLDAKRDWGYAKDYVEAMWTMLQQDKPDDFVIATGETHTVKEFVDVAFKFAGLKYQLVDLHELSKEDADKEIAKLRKQKDKIFVVQHPIFYRPAEVHLLLGNPAKAKKMIGWNPKVSFKELVEMMVKHDLEKNADEGLLD